MEDDDNQMKKLIGLLVLCIVFSLSAVAQHGGHENHGGGRPEVGGGRQTSPGTACESVHSASG